MVTFKESTHTYAIDGIEVVSVTQALEEAGLVDFSVVNREVLKRAQSFGEAVHQACHLDDLGILDIDTVDKPVKPFLDAYRKFRKEMKFIIQASEEVVASEKYMYAGTLDKRGVLNGKMAIVDLKTGQMYKTTALQTAGYQEAYNEGKSRKEQIKTRWAVQLKKDGSYALDEYTDSTDRTVFLACVAVANWKRREI
jgi:hypothetical protein